MRDLKEKVNAKIAVPVASGAALAGTFATPMLAFADDPASVATVTSSLTTALSGFADSALSAIGTIIPVVLPIMGAIVIVGIGVRVFKRFAK